MPPTVKLQIGARGKRATEAVGKSRNLLGFGTFFRLEIFDFGFLPGCSRPADPAALNVHFPLSAAVPCRAPPPPDVLIRTAWSSSLHCSCLEAPRRLVHTSSFLAGAKRATCAGLNHSFRPGVTSQKDVAHACDTLTRARKRTAAVFCSSCLLPFSGFKRS